MHKICNVINNKAIIDNIDDITIIKELALYCPDNNMKYENLKIIHIYLDRPECPVSGPGNRVEIGTYSGRFLHQSASLKHPYETTSRTRLSGSYISHNVIEPRTLIYIPFKFNIY